MSRKKVEEVSEPRGKTLVIPAQRLSGLLIHVEGTSPLIVHRFGNKARTQIRETQAKTAQKGAKSARGPEQIAEEIIACHYEVAGSDKLGPTEGRFGFPASGFKGAAVSAAPFGTGLFKSRVKSLFYVRGDVVPVTCERIEPREDAVRLENGVVQLRYRPYYFGWKASLGIKFSPDSISAEQIINLFDLAGSLVGVGENRPGKTGNSFGQWKVVSVETCLPDDLPVYQMATEDNSILAQAREIARSMGGVS